MPEGDTIYRTARALGTALIGRAVTRFESVFPRLTRVDDDQPLAGRHVEDVEARGKHLLMRFSGDLVLRTHMRMHGSWHLYRPGERWRRPAHELRIRLVVPGVEAVAFSVPVAEFLSPRDIERHRELGTIGPDPLAPRFRAEDVVTRLAAHPEEEIGTVLLNQRVMAGIGNIYKSETLFVAGVFPFAKVGDLSIGTVARLVGVASKLLRASAQGGRSRFWVYSRGGLPCRRCGAAITSRRQGTDVRWTYWCDECQREGRVSDTTTPRA